VELRLAETATAIVLATAGAAGAKPAIAPVLTGAPTEDGVHHPPSHEPPADRDPSPSRHGGDRLQERRVTFRQLLSTTAPREVVLIRLAVGLTFTSEGVQKFLFPAARGAGRFAKIGMPWPEVLGPAVGAIEVLCGALVLLGLATRLAAIHLACTMVVALGSTKVPILLGRGVWMFASPSPSKGTGIWSMLHESRTDIAMLMGALFLLGVGAGPWSLDGKLTRKLHGGGA
jgi:uncharacterized membrane protein YphA (DoxX/SURF4 family)